MSFLRLGREIGAGEPRPPHWRDPDGGPDGRAGALLWAHLDDTQRDQWARTFTFDVTTKYRGGQTTWRIAAYDLQVIAVEGRYLRGRLHARAITPGTRMCVYPNTPGARLPEADIALAKKLMLETRRGRRHVIRHAHWLARMPY